MVKTDRIYRLVFAPSLSQSSRCVTNVSQMLTSSQGWYVSQSELPESERELPASWTLCALGILASFDWLPVSELYFHSTSQCSKILLGSVLSLVFKLKQRTSLSLSLSHLSTWVRYLVKVQLLSFQRQLQSEAEKSFDVNLMQCFHTFTSKEDLDLPSLNTSKRSSFWGW